MDKHVQVTPKTHALALAKASGDIEQRMRYETRRYIDRQRRLSRAAKDLAWCMLGLAYCAGVAVAQHSLWLVQWFAFGSLSALSIYQMLKYMSLAKAGRDNRACRRRARGIALYTAPGLTKRGCEIVLRGRQTQANP